MKSSHWCEWGRPTKDFLRSRHRNDPRSAVCGSTEAEGREAGEKDPGEYIPVPAVHPASEPRARS